MAKIMFLGGIETGNVGVNRWGRFLFELNKWVECDDPHIIAKASINRFFAVDGDGGKVEAEIVPLDDLMPPDDTENVVQAILEEELTEAPPIPKRRGRPPKAKDEAA